MPKTLHFHDMASYHRWLAYGHIHHKFHGRANIMIRGKHHAVVHKSHHQAREIHEAREGRTRVIQLKIGRGSGLVIQGARSSTPYRKGKTKVPSNIWGGIEKGRNTGFGVNIRFPKLNLGI